MNSAKLCKLQYLMISQLLKEGSVQLILPDGVLLDIGIVQEDNLGKSKKQDNYCYVIASRKEKKVMLDSYNLGIEFESGNDTILYENEILNKEGKIIKTVDVC